MQATFPKSFLKWMWLVVLYGGAALLRSKIKCWQEVDVGVTSNCSHTLPSAYLMG